MGFFLYVVMAVLILLLMITIHEFGHYISGKLLKFKINEFSIGFGPKLFSKKNKTTGEVFSIRAIPLGGFCAFEGEDGAEQDTKKDVFDTQEQNPTQKKFTDHKPWQRIIVLLSGGVFNIISAIIFSFIFITAIGMENPHQNISLVLQNSNNIAYNDFKVGDKVLAVDGKNLTFMYTLSDAILNSGDSAEFLIEREGESSPIIIVASKKTIEEWTDSNGTVYEESFGFGIRRTGERTNGLRQAIVYSVPFTAKLSLMILGSLGDLVTGNIPLSEITGPVGTVTAIAEESMQNWRVILILLPLIAANLGIFNLLPIPALDGSKIVFCIIEWIRKKPINRNVENMIHFIGLILLFGFIIFVDIAGIFVRCGV